MLRRLRSIGMLRREKEPSAALVSELFASAGERLTCSQCGATGLRIVPVEDIGWDDAWDADRPCSECGRPIGAERVRLLPNVALCIACQRVQESGRAVGEPTYCPKCGAVMTLRLRSGGVTRYELTCPACRR
jgi:ribosomal protein S27AE